MVASDSFGFPACSFIEKETLVRMFIVNFAKSLRTSFVRTPPDDCFLCLSVNLKSFSDHLFYRAPLGNYLFHLQVAEFQPPHTVNKYFTCALYKHFIQKEVAIRRGSCT